jgi:hypothetical protein
MATRCLSEWLELTELDFGFYGGDFTDAAVNFVAALRFQNVADHCILESVEQANCIPLVLGSAVGRMDAALPEDEWVSSTVAILAVARLSDTRRRDLYDAVERMLHSKLCRQAGFLE